MDGTGQKETSQLRANSELGLQGELWQKKLEARKRNYFPSATETFAELIDRLTRDFFPVDIPKLARSLPPALPERRKRIELVLGATRAWRERTPQ
jgi:hypothetical protein